MTYTATKSKSIDSRASLTFRPGTVADTYAVYRSIISSAEVRAQALYLKVGIYPRFPIYYFGRNPEAVTVVTDLLFEPISASPENLEILSSIALSMSDMPFGRFENYILPSPPFFL